MTQQDDTAWLFQPPVIALPLHDRSFLPDDDDSPSLWLEPDLFFWTTLPSPIFAPPTASMKRKQSMRQRQRWRLKNPWILAKKCHKAKYRRRKVKTQGTQDLDVRETQAQTQMILTLPALPSRPNVNRKLDFESETCIL